MRSSSPAHGHQVQSFTPDAQHTVRGIGVDLGLAVGQQSGVTLQIQLSVPHQLQPRQPRHHIRRQVKQLRHALQDAALFPFSFHALTSPNSMRPGRRSCLSRT